MNSQDAAIAAEYCELLIAKYGRVDFRGIMQVRHMVRFKIEELYVHSRAVSGMPGYSPFVGRPYEREVDEVEDGSHESRWESRWESEEFDACAEQRTRAGLSSCVRRCGTAAD